MKTIEVVAAVIERDGLILATERGYGEYIGLWEFPGGKVEPGETGEEAIVREIHEEMNADIDIERFIMTVDYDYPSFHLTMHCYLAHLVSAFELLEHQAAKWVDAGDAEKLEWLPADVEVLDELKDQGII